MPLDEHLKNTIDEKEYKFLNTISDLILVGYGGSHAYGTNTPESDMDIRGIYMNPREELIGCSPDSEQKTDSQTDTTIYSFKKITKLLYDCNPNVIEMLGLRPQDYMYMTNVGKMLIDNRYLFLSKRAAKTFGGYALSQLNRLVNKSGRTKNELTANEVRSMDKAFSKFADRYQKYAESNSKIKVYESESGKICFDMNLKNLPIDTTICIFNEINEIDKNYKNSSRNNKATEHGKLSKHMMHLIRLYMMGIDILEKGEIITYRTDEHDLLMSIRNGDYLESDKITISDKFEKLIDEYKTRFYKASEESKLPDRPNFDAINNLIMQITMMKLNNEIKEI